MSALTRFIKKLKENNGINIKIEEIEVKKVTKTNKFSKIAEYSVSVKRSEKLENLYYLLVSYTIKLEWLIQCNISIKRVRA